MQWDVPQSLFVVDQKLTVASESSCSTPPLHQSILLDGVLLWSLRDYDPLRSLSKIYKPY